MEDFSDIAILIMFLAFALFACAVCVMLKFPTL